MSEAAATVTNNIRDERLKLGRIAFFSFGDVVDGTISFGFGAFVFYYLTAVIGLPGTIVGGLLAFSITCDAVLDPLIGSISDTTRSRFGRRLPFMFIAGFPAALAFALLYAIPESLSGGALVFHVGAMLVLLRLSMSFFYLPYVAASAELSDIYSERSKIALYRSFFGCAANVVLLVLGYWVFMRGREGLLDREAYAAFGVTIWIHVRLSASLDEFNRQVQYFALAIAFPVSLVAAFAIGYLAGEGLMTRFDPRDLPFVMVLAYAISFAVAWRRYQ